MNNRTDPILYIVIPCYNEQEVLPITAPMFLQKLADLTAAYNNVAVPYNEIATAVNENGWMNDEQTAAEMKALSDTLGFIGKGLTEDISLLDGSDFDALIDYLENEFPPALEELSERVSVPYEAG